MRDQEKLPEIDRRTKTELGERRGILLWSRSVHHPVASTNRKAICISIPQELPKPPGQSPPPQALASNSTPHLLPLTNTQPHNPETPPDTAPAYSALAPQSAPALHIPSAPLKTQTPNQKYKTRKETYHSNSSTQSNHPPNALP